jgi:hypothetical protein
VVDDPDTVLDHVVPFVRAHAGRPGIPAAPRVGFGAAVTGQVGDAQ